jgi:hypothetical protein
MRFSRPCKSHNTWKYNYSYDRRSHRSSVSNNVLAIQRTALGIEQGILMLHGMMSRLSLYNCNTVYIEDALGWTLPIILDSHPSWEVSNSSTLHFTAGVLN